MRRLSQSDAQPRGPGRRGRDQRGVPLKLFAAVRIALIPSAGARLVLRVRKNKVAESMPERTLERRRETGFVESP